MEIKSDFLFLVMSAFSVAGILEYIKSAIAANVPKWVFAVLSPLACIGVAVAGGGDFHQIATNAIATLAMSQLLYQSIIQVVKKYVEKLEA